MDLRAYLEVLRARKWLLLACVLLSTAAAAGVSLMKEPVYAARATLFVSAGNEGDIGQVAIGAQFTTQRVQSYTRVITSPLVTGPVSESLGLDERPEQLAARISASAPAGQVVIDVSVSHHDPAQAVAIANAVATRFTAVLSELERADAAGEPIVKATVIEPATSAPQVAPSRGVDVGLGLVGGLLIGVVFSLVREALDTSIRTTEALREYGLTPLASIGRDNRAARQPLVVQVDPHSSRAESFRQLRTNLQFANIDNPPKSLLITSSVPGEGKSTTAVNLALTLAEGGTNVLLIEGDLRRPKVGEYLGLEGAVGLTDVLVGRVDVDDAVQSWGSSGRLRVLLAGPQPPNPAELLGSHHMRELLARLEESALVLIDAPPLLPVTDAAVLSNAVDGVIVVVAAGKTRTGQLRQSIENLRQAGAAVLGAVYNMAPSKGTQAYAYGYGTYRPTSPAAGDEATRPTTPASSGSLEPPRVESFISRSGASAPVVSDSPAPFVTTPGSTGESSATTRLLVPDADSQQHDSKASAAPLAERQDGVDEAEVAPLSDRPARSSEPDRAEPPASTQWIVRHEPPTA